MKRHPALVAVILGLVVVMPLVVGIVHTISDATKVYKVAEVESGLYDNQRQWLGRTVLVSGYLSGHGCPHGAFCPPALYDSLTNAADHLDVNGMPLHPVDVLRTGLSRLPLIGGWWASPQAGTPATIYRVTLEREPWHCLAQPCYTAVFVNT